tara:strand:- start:443 stop:838 length:396 start_codon:yes stop_codon:yes gene_type:complete
LYASKIIFFSTKFNEVNVRNGPGLNHLLLYKILVKGYPLKEMGEFNNWKKVQDFSGRVGWISKSQLSGHKYIITIVPDQYLYKFPTNNSKRIAIVKKESLLKIIKETEGWLLLESDGVKGWITKDAVWGLN